MSRARASATAIFQAVSRKGRGSTFPNKEPVSRRCATRDFVRIPSSPGQPLRCACRVLCNGSQGCGTATPSTMASGQHAGGSEYQIQNAAEFVVTHTRLDLEPVEGEQH